MPIPVVPIAHDERTKIAMDMFSEAYSIIRIMCSLSPMETCACVAQSVGHKAGCNDAQREVDPAYVNRGEIEAFKQMVLVNFDYAYNSHRAIHERAECLTKPKPGIV